MKISKPNSTKEYPQRMHGVFKQCSRCWKTYNSKTRKKECPHDVSADLADSNNFDFWTEQPRVTFVN